MAPNPELSNEAILRRQASDLAESAKCAHMDASSHLAAAASIVKTEPLSASETQSPPQHQQAHGPVAGGNDGLLNGEMVKCSDVKTEAHIAGKCTRNS